MLVVLHFPPARMHNISFYRAILCCLWTLPAGGRRTCGRPHYWNLPQFFFSFGFEFIFLWGFLCFSAFCLRQPSGLRRRADELTPKGTPDRSHDCVSVAGFVTYEPVLVREWEFLRYVTPSGLQHSDRIRHWQVASSVAQFPDFDMSLMEKGFGGGGGLVNWKSRFWTLLKPSGYFHMPPV